MSNQERYGVCTLYTHIVILWDGTIHKGMDDGAHIFD